MTEDTSNWITAPKVVGVGTLTAKKAETDEDVNVVAVEVQFANGSRDLIPIEKSSQKDIFELQELLDRGDDPQGGETSAPPPGGWGKV